MAKNKFKERRGRARQLLVKKKLADRKRRARRDNNNDVPQPKFKHHGVPIKGQPPIPPDERRIIRAENLQSIQKNKRTNLYLQNRGLSEVLNDAENRHNKFKVESNLALSELDKHNINQTFKNYYKEFKKVVEAADVILEVLDARDPLGSRCSQIEQTVINAGSGKRLVLVLNKIDLIPKENLEKWLKYLRQELPTVAFKASTQTQKDHLSHSKVAAIHMNQNLQSSRHCIGASFLMKVLGNYCRNKNILTSIRVGVVGFPNVGKSSIINSLKRCRTCVVGGTPGVTKTMQEVMLDKHIRLLDSPGIAFAKEGSRATLALRNAVKIEKLDDVITPAEAIIQRATCQQLVDHYKVPEFSSSDEFLSNLARQIGRFKKGGIPDVNDAARKVLNDWNNGTLKFYAEPPEVFQPSSYISAEIVSEMGKAFDIGSLEETMEIEMPKEEVPVVSEKPQTSLVVNIEKKKNEKTEDKCLEDKEYFIPLELQQNKIVKKLMKKNKKKLKRNNKIASALSDTLDSLNFFNP